MKVELENLGTVNKNMVRFENENGEYIELYFSYKTVEQIQAHALHHLY